MFFKYPVLFLYGAHISLASTSSLCIQGCCGLELQFPPQGLALSSESGVSVQLLGSELQCCECNKPTDLLTKQVPLATHQDEDLLSGGAPIFINRTNPRHKKPQHIDVGYCSSGTTDNPCCNGEIAITDTCCNNGLWTGACAAVDDEKLHSVEIPKDGNGTKPGHKEPPPAVGFCNSGTNDNPCCNGEIAISNACCNNGVWTGACATVDDEKLQSVKLQKDGTGTKLDHKGSFTAVGSCSFGTSDNICCNGETALTNNCCSNGVWTGACGPAPSVHEKLPLKTVTENGNGGDPSRKPFDVDFCAFGEQDNPCCNGEIPIVSACCFQGVWVCSDASDASTLEAPTLNPLLVGVLAKLKSNTKLLTKSENDPQMKTEL